MIPTRPPKRPKGPRSREWTGKPACFAYAHNVYIGGSNRRGIEPPWTQEYFGASYFAVPNGVVPPLGSPVPELVLAELDLDLLRGPDPSGWNLARDRRPAIYRGEDAD